MDWVTKGWVIFEYEGEGQVTMRQRSCSLQPPGKRYHEVHHSDDMELIELMSPAEFSTAEADAP